MLPETILLFPEVISCFFIRRKLKFKHISQEIIMLIILSILAIGIVLGIFIQERKRMIKINDKLMTWSIFVLLFLLGISVGVNDTIIYNLDTIGLKAVGITIGAVVGSIVMARIIFPVLFPQTHKKKEQIDEE